MIHSYFIQSCIDNSHREDIDNTYPITQLQARRGIIALGIAVHKYSIYMCNVRLYLHIMYQFEAKTLLLCMNLELGVVQGLKGKRYRHNFAFLVMYILYTRYKGMDNEKIPFYKSR